MKSCFLKQNVRKKDNDNGWITVGIHNSCRRKEFLYTLTKNQNNLLKSYYKSYCRIIRRVIIEAKRLHYNRLIESAEDRVKTTWSIINRETGQKINNIDSLPKSFQRNTAKVNIGEAAHK
jgi:phage FluMu gp28-like protein